MPRKKNLYVVSGPVPGLHNPIEEYVHAYSEPQAKKLIGFRLRDKHPTIRIWLGDCSVVMVPNKERSD